MLAVLCSVPLRSGTGAGTRGQAYSGTRYPDDPYYYLALDGHSQTFKPWKVASMISEKANALLYSLADTYIGKGIVGETLISYEA